MKNILYLHHMAFNNNNRDFDAAEAFMHTMMSYLKNYKAHLEKILTKNTVRKHASLVVYFIDELYSMYAVTCLEQITLGMCGSKFVRSYNSNCDEKIQLQTAKNMLYRFFRFIADSQDIMFWPLLRKLKP